MWAGNEVSLRYETVTIGQAFHVQQVSADVNGVMVWILLVSEVSL